MFLKYSMWIIILKDIEQCKELAHFIIIDCFTEQKMKKKKYKSKCWIDSTGIAVV